MDAKPQPDWQVSGKQRQRAGGLRADMTDAEKVMWAELRAHRLGGIAFRRQAPIGPVDFFAPAAKLVIEIDGGHFEDAGRARDARRDAFLASEGYRVLRFSNLDVLKNRDGVLEVALEAIGRAVPPPNPPPQAGEG
jgi:very-short-patch-repair endonuclease